MFQLTSKPILRLATPQAKQQRSKPRPTTFFVSFARRGCSFTSFAAIGERRTSEHGMGKESNTKIPHLRPEGRRGPIQDKRQQPTARGQAVPPSTPNRSHDLPPRPPRGGPRGRGLERLKAPKEHHLLRHLSQQAVCRRLFAKMATDINTVRKAR